MDIKTFIQTYKDGNVQITGSINYSTRTVIEENERLRHGIFSEPNFTDGTKKLFYKVVFAFANLIYRNTDIDTKDINMKSTNGGSVDLVALVRMGVKAWLKNIKFGTKINEFRRELIDMGHLLVKVVYGEPKIVNLLNVIIPPHVDSVQESGLVEATYLTWDDMKKYKNDFKKNWSDIEELYEKMKKGGEVYFTVYEHWTIDKFDGEIQKGCIKYLDRSLMQADQANTPDNWNPYLELDRYKSPYKRKIRNKKLQKKLGEYELIYPYLERRFIKLKGRYLGFGVYELLQGLQEDYNEKMNLKRKFDRLMLRGIIVHRQPSDISKARTLTQEFINAVETGTIIDVENDEDLQRLNFGSMTSDVVAMIDKLFELMRVIIGVTAQGTGEETPATTTATIGIINQKVAQTTFDIVVEEQALFLSELFQDFLLEEILDNLDAEDWVEITDNPKVLAELERILVENKVNDMIARQWDKLRQTYTADEIIMIAQSEKERLIKEGKRMGETRFAQIKKDLLKDIDLKIEFFVNNESFDKNTQIRNILAMLNSSNYTGSRKALEEELRDLIGLSGDRYEKSEEEKQEEIKMLQARSMAENPMQGTPDTSVTPAREFSQANSLI